MLLESEHWWLCSSRARPRQPKAAQDPWTVGGRKSDSPRRGPAEGREGFSFNFGFSFGVAFSFPLFQQPSRAAGALWQR